MLESRALPFLESNSDHLIMSFVSLEEEDVSWAQSPKEPGDIVKDAIKKEQMIKCVLSLTDGWP